MKYVSTRGEAPSLGFEEVLLTGLARDGGLYLPESWPQLSREDIASFAGLSYQETAFRVMKPYVCPEISEDDFADLIDNAYATFRHKAVTPLSQLDSNEWILELFHGPTLAFKDVALQLLGHLFDHVLTRQGRRITIVGATSGDTGSAAIDCVRDRGCAEIFMLHPKGRVSEVQRRQMTTVQSANVHNIAVEGTFDDCQALVKAMFNDLAFRDEIALSAVNSINWARVMAQIVYYFTSAVALGAPARPISYSVPTGNFGDVYAGYVARCMGLPIEQLVVATNINDILARSLTSGDYTVGTVQPTISPSMDIQVSSNFERLLYNLYDGQAAEIRRLMENLKQAGSFTIDGPQLEKAQALFEACRVSEEDTRATIREVYDETEILLDPHTAVGVCAARSKRRRAETPMVTLSTAHPAKFPDAVEAVTGKHPALPDHMADLFSRPEKYDSLPNDLGVIQAYIRDTLK
ncbi:threonine synthase [Luteithermobacter gelatinilyticus]|uniref:threonine synthase n=1 Tax=Luteithermobacter gelatinilyticus TaxID=2582913 RepID=UPI001106E377|nr:threonine synthase [Luteithermobacter gelatinilyticus]